MIAGTVKGLAAPSQKILRLFLNTPRSSSLDSRQARRATS